MIDIDHLARSIANVLQGAGFDPHRIAETGRLLNIEGRIRQQAGEKIVNIKKSLNLGVPERTNSSAGPQMSGAYHGLNRNQETMNGEVAQG